MKKLIAGPLQHAAQRGFVLAALMLSPAALAQSWQVTTGAQSEDQGTQALAFLPNEIWIHAGDSVSWTIGTDEPHTITFLKAGQVRPSFQVGCPGTTPDGSTFDGSLCVNSGRITNKGQTFTVTFPSPGNYKLVCLVHVNMTGIVHVLNPSEALPHNQDFYATQAASQQHDLLSDAERESPDGPGSAPSKPSSSDNADPQGNQVVTGSGELLSRPGGIQSVSRMRFMRPTIEIHVRETVEWVSDDVSGHTITFGEEPPNASPATPPSANVFVDVDGARHAIISSPSDNVHSGFIGPAPQERTGLPQAPAGVTRFRVTFTNPGTYSYICAFHDDVGMKGQVVVKP